MLSSLIHEYAESLGTLAGDAFEQEVCSRLQTAILGFQTVPAKPSGDAGLDGLSHNGERGYCCYGLEHDQFKTAKERVTAIVKKFRSDLRRLCELAQEKKKLVQVENEEMATILPDNVRLKHIDLIVNWFESHQILNPLFTSFADYKSASACRYVDPNATVTVVGPKNLAQTYAVDEITLYRARHRVSAQKIQKKAQTLQITDPKDFEWKMDVLKQIRPDKISAIHNMADQFRNSWRMALAFERELNETLPTLHRVLEEHRRRIMLCISQLMISCSEESWKELPAATTLALNFLKPDFEKLYGSLINDVASGEVARLIGECTISWEKSKVIQ